MAPDESLVEASLLERVALPLLQQLAEFFAIDPVRRPPVIALNGPVGAGKTSLGRALERLAPQVGVRLAVASIDDLYLPWNWRRELLEGNPFGVGRVPPGSHDVPLLLEQLDRWRGGAALRLPRFDKTLAEGQGDRNGWQELEADALVLEGWLMGCRALGAEGLAHGLARLEDVAEAVGSLPQGAPALTPSERAWLPRWDRELEAYTPLWQACDGLWVLRPARWDLPLRWRLQAEARQRRDGGGWLPAQEVERLVRASLCSLPPLLYQDPLVACWPWAQACAGGRQSGPHPTMAMPEASARPDGLPLLGAVVLDGRRRCRPVEPQSSLSSASSAMG